MPILFTFCCSKQVYYNKICLPQISLLQSNLKSVNTLTIENFKKKDYNKLNSPVYLFLMCLYRSIGLPVDVMLAVE